MQYDGSKLSGQSDASGDSRASLRSIYDVVRSDGEHELERSTSALIWSGIAAGMAMSLSLITEGLLHHGLPQESWRPLITNFGYSAGFLVVILGRQQLFTETTLTVVIPLLRDRTIKTISNVLRVWSVVLVCNLLGGALVAIVLAKTQTFSPEVQASFQEIGRTAMEPSFGVTVLRGIFAGWLIALLVWILPAAGSARFWAIIVFAYLIGLAHFSHVIAGSIEVFYLAAAGSETWTTVLLDYSMPALIGNVLGGVFLTTVANHSQVVADE